MPGQLRRQDPGVSILPPAMLDVSQTIKFAGSCASHFHLVGSSLMGHVDGKVYCGWAWMPAISAGCCEPWKWES
jgi:hypothetical protein